MSPRRRAYSLLLLLAILPTMAVLGSALAYLINRTGQVQTRAVLDSENDVTLLQLARAWREDAAGAMTAELDESGNATTLRLVRSGGEVTYAAANHTIVRRERENGDEATETRWKLRRARVAFVRENLAPGRQVVWLRCIVAHPRSGDLPFEEAIATAAHVGVARP